MKLTFTVEADIDAYCASATYGDYHIITDGRNSVELMDNILEAANLAFEDQGITIKSSDVRLVYSLKFFFSQYRCINASGLARRIGMNQSLLAQYASGKKSPSRKQVERIMRGIRQLGKELSRVNLSG